MASISYSIGEKFNPITSMGLSLPGYAGPENSYSAGYNNNAQAIFFENMDTHEGGYITSGLSGFSLKYDFSDNLIGVYLDGFVFGDLIIGSQGTDTLLGGFGDDTIIGGAGSDDLSGGDGIDTLSYETSASGVSVDLMRNLVSGGDASGDLISGFENVRGSAGNDTLLGDDNANMIEGWGGRDVILAEGGDDRIVLRGVELDFGLVDGGEGRDILTLEGGINYVFGTGSILNVEQVNVGDRAFADFSALDATPGMFRSASGLSGGSDITTTAFGEDIRLGLGSDTLDAGAGDDRIYIYAGGAPKIDGGDGNDRLYIQSGAHTFNDETLQNVEAITVRAGAGVDLGEMTTGMRVTSTSSVESGGLYMWGGAGDDVIRLGAGGDQVWGGFGDDRLIGGAGADTFNFSIDGFGRDQVTADLSMDRISVYGVASSLDDLNYRVAANGRDVVVTFDNMDPKTNTIILKGVTLEAVQAAEDTLFSFW